MRHRFMGLALIAAVPCAASQLTFQLSNPPAAAETPVSMLAIWGTPEQCQAHAVGRHDNISQFPYVITDQWLSRGALYCFIHWREQRKSENGLRARATLQCGEDAVRDYQAYFTLSDGFLEIRWSEDFTTQRLERCG